MYFCIVKDSCDGSGLNTSENSGGFLSDIVQLSCMFSRFGISKQLGDHFAVLVFRMKVLGRFPR